jgi:hypothetical protein
MILHIFRNDLRRNRFALLAYFCGLGLTALLLNLPLSWNALGTLGGMAMLVAVIAAMLLTAFNVLADAPANPEGQWLGRPIGWKTLCAAKLLYTLLVIWLPMTLVGGLMWLGSFTPAQAAWSGLEISLYLAGLLAVILALAAASRNIQQCMGFGAALWGCLVIAAMVLGALRNIWQPPRLKMPQEHIFVSLYAIAFVAGLILCIWQYRSRRPRHALLPLCLLAALVPLCFPEALRQPQPATPLPGHLRLTSANTAGSGQTFFHNLRLEGLPPDHFAAPHDLEITFHSDKPHKAGHNRTRHDLHPEFADAQIQAALPAGCTLTWDSDKHRHVERSLSRRLQKTGRLQGSIQLQITRVISLGGMPVEVGARLHNQGYVASVSRIDINGKSRSVRIERTQPQLLFTRDTSVRRHRSDRRRTTLFVAYNPSQKRARAISSHGYGSRGDGWPMLEVGHEQFHIHHGEEQVFVFRFARVSLHDATFDFPEHRIQGPPAAESAPKTFRDAPANILASVPLNSGERKRAYEILKKELKKSHLPALVKALPRDPELASFLKPEWAEAAREPLLAHVARRRPNTPPVLVSHASELPDADPADLRWHLIHNYGSVSYLYSRLTTRVDFDADSALAEAWSRRRTLGKMDLHTHALRAGLPGAFEGALREEMRQGSGRLFELVEGYQGKRKDFGSWLVQHAPDLHYDASTRKYRRNE